MFRLPPKLIIRLGKGKVWCRKCGKLQDIIKDDTDPKAFKTWCKGCTQLMTYNDMSQDFTPLGTVDIQE